MGNLTPEEEIALRRIANESINVEPKLAKRLVQLNLVEPFKDAWRLTPLGRRQYEGLARPSLLHRKHPSYINKLLDKAIPLARAAGIPQPDPIVESEDAGTERSTAGPAEQMAEIGSHTPAAEQTEHEELPAQFSTAPSDFRCRLHQTKIETDRAVANSREALNRSWRLLTNTARMVSKTPGP